MRSDVIKCGYIQFSVIGTSDNIMTEQWFVYMKQRFLSITSDNVVFNENNILRVQKRNCVISIQLRPFPDMYTSQESGQACVCVLEVSILPLSASFL